jgi:anthranilate phosphoribosyltransferase
LGVYDPDLTEPLAYALKELGLKSALVVHGMDGLDELSVCAPTKITQLKDGRVISGRLDPEDLGLPKRDREAVKGGDAVENAGLLRDVLNGTQGARRDIALLNAGAAFIAAGKAEGFEDGLELARRSVDSGAAREKLAQYLAFGA